MCSLDLEVQITIEAHLEKPGWVLDSGVRGTHFPMLQICESSRSKPAGTSTAGITLTVNTIHLSHDYKQLSCLLTPSIPFSQAKASAWSKMCSFLCTNNCCQEVGPSLDQRGFLSLAACGKGNFLQSLSVSILGILL